MTDPLAHGQDVGRDCHEVEGTAHSEAPYAPWTLVGAATSPPGWATLVTPGRSLLGAGLTQAELAAKAGVAPSVISVYESGRRQRSIPTLAALIAATGYELDLSVGQPRQGNRRLTGPVGRRLRRRRTAALALAESHGVRILGVFGSVARGEDRPDSDIDLLVEFPEGTGLFAVARVQNELEALLGAPVDLIPASGLKAEVRPTVEADLVSL